MEIKKIREIVKILESSSLAELEIREGEEQIILKKPSIPAPPPGCFPPEAPYPYPAPPVQMPGVAGASVTAPVAPGEDADDEEALIVSPIVGMFYSAPAPDAPAYVRVGDRVRKGETVCILEAMKLMNEIPCEFDCEIEAVLVSNEQKVEYGQPLFRVRRVK